MTETEARFFAAVDADQAFDLREPGEATDAALRGADWPAARTISLDCIAWLCTSGEARDRVAAHGLRVAGARIEVGDDPQALASIDVPIGVALTACYFPDEFSISNSSFRQFSLSRSCLEKPLAADGLVVAKSLRMIGATIHGDANLRRLQSGDDVDFTAAQIEGAVFLPGAKIDGDLRFSDASVGATDSAASSADAIAVNLDLASVGGTLYFDTADEEHGGFSAHGVVRLVLAQIGGNLDCWGGRFAAGGSGKEGREPGDALFANGVRIGGSVFLAHNMTAEGVVSLRTARIEHYLNIYELGDGRGPAFGDARVDLQACRAGTLNCDTLSWTRPGRLSLNGLEYDRIELVKQVGEVETPMPLTDAEFTSWLAQQAREPFFPQPYEHLAAVLRREGYHDQARDVLVHKDQELGARMAGGVRKFLWFRLYGPLTGFGHDPLRGFRLLLGIWILGAGVFAIASRRGWMVAPAQLDEPWQSIGSSRPEPTRLQPLIYSLDVLAPIIDLGQASRWTPDRRQRGGAVVQWFHWGLTIFGWTLTTLVVAGLTGLLKV